MSSVQGRPIAAALERIRRVRSTGDGFATYDAALKAVHAHPQSLALAYMATLQAARIGAFSEAARLFETYDLAKRLDRGEADPTVPLEDLLALAPRLAKDRALDETGPDRSAALAQAARSYLDVFGRTGGYYPLVNVATLFALAGAGVEAADQARQALGLLQELPPATDPGERSWRSLTAVEAHLVLADLEKAREAARSAAASFHGDYGDLATSVRQLERLVRAKGLDFDVGRELGMPAVLHFAGHIIAAPGQDGRFPAAQEKSVATAIDRFLAEHRIGWAYGSLAAGADILIVERLLKRRAKVHIVLPFALAEFVEVSVRPSGPQWVERFERCRARAASCRTVVEGGYHQDDSLFASCSAYAIGLARLQARQLGATLRQLLVWDGEERPGVAGTSADHRLGQAVGAAAHIVPLRPQRAVKQPSTRAAGMGGAEASGDLPPLVRRARAMIFCDVVGFSRIHDDDLPQFNAGILGSMAAAVARLATPPEVVETWGDAVFLVFEDVADAAAGALALLDGVHRANLGALGLPSHLDLRVSAHYGSTFDILNPFTARPGVLGIHVSRAARIEPVTPPGVIYVSEAFAAHLAVKADPRYRADFVGTTRLAKKFGDLPVFRLVAEA